VNAEHIASGLLIVLPQIIAYVSLKKNWRSFDFQFANDRIVNCQLSADDFDLLKKPKPTNGASACEMWLKNEIALPRNYAVLGALATLVSAVGRCSGRIQVSSCLAAHNIR
jgi:hypothetical protein